MLNVTFKLKNAPAKGDRWRISVGANTPFLDWAWEWVEVGRSSLDKPITGVFDESNIYMKVWIDILVPLGSPYTYEVTTPLTFIDQTTYIWDYSTNSLSAEAPAPVEGKPLDAIFSLVWSISDFLYNAHLVVKDWWAPFNYLDIPLVALYNAFFDLLTPIANLGVWVDDVADKIGTAFSSADIIKLLQTWLTYAEDTWSWVKDAVTNVGSITSDWWDNTKVTVQGWIDTATEGLPALIVAVENFFTVTLPTLFDLKYAEEWWKGKSLGVYNLITSTLSVWFPDYDDLVMLWSDTKLFFANPLDWLLDHFTDWFLGKE